MVQLYQMLTSIDFTCNAQLLPKILELCTTKFDQCPKMIIELEHTSSQEAIEFKEIEKHRRFTVNHGSPGAPQFVWLSEAEQPPGRGRVVAAFRT
jgi:hypothetical protein